MLGREVEVHPALGFGAEGSALAVDHQAVGLPVEIGSLEVGKLGDPAVRSSLRGDCSETSYVRDTKLVECVTPAKVGNLSALG